MDLILLLPIVKKIRSSTGPADNAKNIRALLITPEFKIKKLISSAISVMIAPSIKSCSFGEDLLILEIGSKTSVMISFLIPVPTVKFI